MTIAKLPPVDLSYQLPDSTRGRIATNLVDPSTVEGAALSANYVAGTVKPAGGSTTPGSVVRIGPEAYIPSTVGTAAIVGGGAANYENVIGGILANVNTPTSNLDGVLPTLTAPNGNWNAIWGGYDNVVNGWACQVQSYHSKIEADANHITIAGGSIHTVYGTCSYGAIGGGTGHAMGGNAAVIAGGGTNTAAGNYSAIGGGQSNTTPGSGAVVSGGSSNQATASNAVVSGGTNNQATAISATVVGGQFNVASGVASVAAGRENLASGAAALATGRDALSTFPGGHAHSAGKFAAQGDAQNLKLLLRGQTTDATPKVLTLDNIAARMTVPADTTWAFSILLAARRADVAGESAGYRIEGVIDRSTASASTTGLVGTPTVTVLGEDNAAWDAAASASTSFGALDITVTGEVGKTILWVATVQITSVTG